MTIPKKEARSHCETQYVSRDRQFVKSASKPSVWRSTMSAGDAMAPLPVSPQASVFTTGGNDRGAQSLHCLQVLLREWALPT